MSGVVRRCMVFSAFHKFKLIYRKSLNLYGNIFMFHNGAARLFTSTRYATVAARHTFIRCSFFWVSSQETFCTLFNVQSLPSWLAQTHQHKQYYYEHAREPEESKHARQSCEVKREMRWDKTRRRKKKMLQVKVKLSSNETMK